MSGVITKRSSSQKAAVREESGDVIGYMEEAAPVAVRCRRLQPPPPPRARAAAAPSVLAQLPAAAIAVAYASGSCCRSGARLRQS